MKTYQHVLVAVLVVLLGFVLRNSLKIKLHVPQKSFSNEIALNITLIGTNDLHSSFSGLGLRSYPELISGGYSRLVSLMHSIRSEKESAGDIVLALDAGDWYSGSLFDHLGADIRTSSVPQLEFFDAAGYDAIIFGNHDFDRYENALFSMLHKAQLKQLRINVIASNLSPLPENSVFQQFSDPNSSVKFVPYIIKSNKSGKVGVLGYVTPDALFLTNDYRKDLQYIGFSRSNGKEYNELLDLAAEQSKMLKNELKCDVVVVIIHGGHKDEEDVGFINLPNVDVVLGGHTHESYFYSNDFSLTSQCGYSGMQMTSLSIGQDSRKQIHFRGVDKKYKEHITAKTPQCINVDSSFSSDDLFEKKVNGWKNEINDMLSVEMDKVLFRGNLTSLLTNDMSHEKMSVAFANMLVSEFNIWQEKVKPGSDPVIATFWNREFFEIDEITHNLEDVTITYDDAYNLIFFTALKDHYGIYMKKEELYYILQGTFIVANLISPLLFIDAGGITYKETRYFGVPVITDLKTIGGVAYEDWPPMVRVLANSISAPYLWKINKFSKGLLHNFPKDKNGNLVKIDDCLEPDSPKELGLFLNYLERQNGQVPSS